MRARGYLITGLAIGSVVGALGSPLVYRTVPLFHASPGVTTPLPETELVLPSRFEAAALAGPTSATTTATPPSQPDPAAEGAGRSGPTIALTSGDAGPEPTPIESPERAAPPPLATPPSGAPTTNAPTTAAPPSPSTTAAPDPFAGPPTVCRKLSADNEAKLRAEPLRPRLDVATDERYGVVVTLVSAQSSRPAQENTHRIDGLAALVGVPATTFSPTDDGRFRTTMTSAQLCQIVYLRSVTALEVTALDRGGAVAPEPTGRTAAEEPVQGPAPGPVQEPPGPKSAPVS